MAEQQYGTSPGGSKPQTAPQESRFGSKEDRKKMGDITKGRESIPLSEQGAAATRFYSQAYGEASPQQKLYGFTGPDTGYRAGTGATTVYKNLPEYSTALKVINAIESNKIAQQSDALQKALNLAGGVKSGNFNYSDQIAKTLQNPKALAENYSAFVNSDANGRPLTGSANSFLAPLQAARPGIKAHAGYSEFDPTNSSIKYGISTGKNLGAINPETSYEQAARDLTAQRGTANKGRGQNVAQSFSTGATAPGANLNTNKYLKNILGAIGA